MTVPKTGGTIMTGPQGQTILTPSSPAGSKVTFPTVVSKGSKPIPAGILLVGAGTVLALADTRFAKPVVWLLAAACVYQAIKPNAGVVSKITTSKPIATKKGS